MIEFIKENELKTFLQQLETLIKETDFTNPIEVTSFGNSLIDMGKYFLNQAYNEAIHQIYSPEELETFLKLIEFRHIEKINKKMEDKKNESN